MKKVISSFAIAMYISDFNLKIENDVSILMLCVFKYLRENES